VDLNFENDVIWSERVMCLLKIKPRLQAEWVVFSEELCFGKLFLSAVRRNLVLD